jgi:bacterioferritin-associated ferredoxin
VCCLAGSPSLIDEVRDDDICAAIERRDTSAMFDSLASGLSFQGVSDEVAYNYMEQHGRPTWRDLSDKLGCGTSCPKLTSYWHFHGLPV